MHQCPDQALIELKSRENWIDFQTQVTFLNHCTQVSYNLHPLLGW